MSALEPLGSDSIGALMIGIVFWGTFYHSKIKEPQNSIGIYEGPDFFVDSAVPFVPVPKTATREGDEGKMREESGGKPRGSWAQSPMRP